MASVDEKIAEIKEAIKDITPIEPGFLHNEGSRNITMFFKGEVPDAESVGQIRSKLRLTGTVITHSFIEPELVTFLIHLWVEDARKIKKAGAKLKIKFWRAPAFFIE